VLVDVPTVGVSKTLHLVDELDMRKVQHEAQARLHKAGDRFVLTGSSGEPLGVVRRAR